MNSMFWEIQCLAALPNMIQCFCLRCWGCKYASSCSCRWFASSWSALYNLVFPASNEWVGHVFP